MHLTITAASTALFSTWLFVENLGLLLDAGDGVSASLGQKGRKVRHVFVTHADRDHLCGLLQLNQLNAKDGSPSIYYPKDCGSFPALRDFVANFDPQSGPANWQGLTAGDTVDLNNGFFIEARDSAHVEAGGFTKALDFTLSSIRKSLKAEYRNLTGPQIANLREQVGEAGITESRTEKLLGYSGDAPALDPAHWEGVRILIHEATFLEPEIARNAHSNLPQVIQAASELPLEALILIHFSARYTTAEIVESIQKEAAKVAPNFPIFAVIPGQVATDILSSPPVWSPDMES